MGLFSFFKRDKSLDTINQIFKPGRPERYNPPKSSGWYRFKNKKSGNYDYAGITNNLDRRAKEHIKAGKLIPDKHWFEFKKTDVPYDMLRTKEVAKIKQYGSQLLNKNIGGGGRSPKIEKNLINKENGKSILELLFKVLTKLPRKF